MGEYEPEWLEKVEPPDLAWWATGTLCHQLRRWQPSQDVGRPASVNLLYRPFAEGADAARRRWWPARGGQPA